MSPRANGAYSLRVLFETVFALQLNPIFSLIYYSCAMPLYPAALLNAAYAII